MAELEALVGHLFIVGGRSLRAASPGAAAVPAPRRAARGRDADTYFCLASLIEDQRQSAAFYEEIVSASSEVYFDTPGSVTAAMRNSIKAANELLLSRGEPVSVGLSCAILKEQELYIAVAGPARAFLVTKAGIERLPSDEDIRDGATALGRYNDPDVRYFHREVQPDDFLILCDSSLNRLTDTTLSFATESGQVDTTLNNLAGVAGDLASAQVIKFVLAEGETLEPTPTKRSGGGFMSGLPIFGGGSSETEVQENEKPQPADDAPPQTVQHEQPAPPTFDVEPPPPRRRRRRMEEPPPAPEKLEPIAAAEEAEKSNPLENAGRRAAFALAQAANQTKTLVDRMLPEDEDSGNLLEQRLRLSTPLQIGVALSVALIATLLTTIVYQARGQNSAYIQLIQQAQSEIEQAREGSDQAASRPHWEAAVVILDEAAVLRAPSPEVASLREEALEALDEYDRVTRVDARLLRDYEAGTVFRGPELNNLNLYLIDTTNDILYREDLDQTGTRLVNQRPQIITRQGELVDNQVVGGLIDLVWIQDEGVQGRDQLGMISRNGLLVTYSPSQDVRAEVLPGFGAWQDPRAIAVVEGDLYILDAAANQIWLYEAESGRYPDTPRLYFTDQTPDLSSAIDMAVDTNGNIFVLHSDGRLTKYFLGREEVFNLVLPQPIVRPTALFLNLSVVEQALYVTDPGGGRLYTTTLTGTFLQNYKDVGNNIFDGLSGVEATDDGQIYVTVGDQLYYFSRP